MYLRAKTSGQSKNIMVQEKKKCISMCGYVYTYREKENKCDKNVNW